MRAGNQGGDIEITKKDQNDERGGIVQLDLSRLWEKRTQGVTGKRNLARGGGFRRKTTLCSSPLRQSPQNALEARENMDKEILRKGKEQKGIQK